jgi:hypothetical protein
LVDIGFSPMLKHGVRGGICWKNIYMMLQDKKEDDKAKLPHLFPAV